MIKNLLSWMKSRAESLKSAVLAALATGIMAVGTDWSSAVYWTWKQWVHRSVVTLLVGVVVQRIHASQRPYLVAAPAPSPVADPPRVA